MYTRMQILVSDTGGTNTRFALYERESHQLSNFRKYPNKDFDSLYAVVSTYLAETSARPDFYCLDLAGPVANGTARLTNINWDVSAVDMSAHTGIAQVLIINDLVAMGLSLVHLDASCLLYTSPSPRDA